MRKLLVAAALALASLPASAGEATGKVVGTVDVAVAKHKANTVVYVKAGDKGPATKKTATMDQNGLVFVPRVLPVQVGWTVDFTNSDPVGHNVFTMDGEKYDLGTWPKGEKRSYTFQKAGAYRQLCKVHDDMIATVLVLDTARFAVSDKEGRFALDLPPGQYTLGVWHEKLGAADVPVTVVAGQSATVTIPLVSK
ncbi:MAG: carboxypeptidase regulatory-like domain-containing protein [Myxococcota bacterium]